MTMRYSTFWLFTGLLLVLASFFPLFAREGMLMGELSMQAQAIMGYGFLALGGSGGLSIVIAYFCQSAEERWYPCAVVETDE